MKSFIKQFNTSNGFIPSKEHLYINDKSTSKNNKDLKPLFIYWANYQIEIFVNLEGTFKFDHLYIEKFMSLDENEKFFMEILRKQKHEKFSLQKDILSDFTYNKSSKPVKEFAKFIKEFNVAPNRFAILENKVVSDNVLILVNNKFLNYNNTSDFYIIKINADLFKETTSSNTTLSIADTNSTLVAF